MTWWRAFCLCLVIAFLSFSASRSQADASAPVIRPLPFAVPGDAAQPNVVALPGHGYVLTWQLRNGSRNELWFAQLDRDGRERRRGRVAAGRDWFINWADFPSLAVLDNGDWVTYWLQKSAASPYAYDIKLTRSTDRGLHWSKPVSPHTDGTPTQHGFVSLLADGADRVLVVWLDGRRAAELPAHAGSSNEHEHDEEAAPMTLRTAVLDRSGQRSGEALLDDSACSCCQTDAVRWAGRVLVAWRDRSVEEVRDIAVTARGVDGQWSPPRILSADHWKIEGCPVNGPALAVSGDRLLAFWPTLVGDQMVQRYTVRQWDQRDAPTQTLDSGDRVRGRVDAAAWGDGFLLTWLGGSDQNAGPRLGVLDVSGRLQNVQILAQSSGSRAVGFARLASQADSALAAWSVPTGGGRMTVKLALVLTDSQRIDLPR